MKDRVMAWLRFLRLPNVLTVPGDVLAGAVLGGGMLAGSWRAVAGVSLAYVFGMALNDTVDVAEDRVHRPERPLPAGEISLWAARWSTLLLSVGALWAWPQPEMVLLLGCVCAYSGLKTRWPPVGGVLMAGCRGMAVWIGAGATWSPSGALWIALGGWMLFIFLVTRLAEQEDRADRPTRLPWVFPMLFFGMGGALWLYRVGGEWLWAVVPLGVLVVVSGGIAVRITRRGGVRPGDIGACLGLLFPLQAMVLLLWSQVGVGVGILVLGVVHRLAVRRIPAS